MRFSHFAMLGAAAIAVGAASGRVAPPSARPAATATTTAKPARSGSILARVWQDMQEDRLMSVAAGVAFYGLLSLAPTLAAAVSIFGLIADPAQLATLAGSLGAVLPQEAAHLVQQEAQRLAQQGAQALSFKLVFALALSLWSSSAAVRAMFDALNVIDEQVESRGLVRLYGTALAATLGGIVIFVVTLALIGANPKFLSFLPDQVVWLYTLVRWPLFFVLAVLVITMLYWIGPSHPPARFWRLVPGAAMAALWWAVASALFSWYVSALANYTATYGSLATVVVVMTWLWLSAVIVLTGAQLNYELTRK